MKKKKNVKEEIFSYLENRRGLLEATVIFKNSLSLTLTRALARALARVLTRALALALALGPEP